MSDDACYLNVPKPDITYRKPGTGRKKIFIKKIANKYHLKTTFTKRRKGLFKKADELSNVGTKVGVFTFSPYGRPYGFGSPSETDVIDEFYNSDHECCKSAGDGGLWWQKSPEDVEFSEIGDFKDSLSELKKNVINRIEEMEMRRKAVRKFFA